jgi:hypothetical protein
MPAKEIISSASVRLFEGRADQLVSKAKLPSDMHGFAILVPSGEEHEWKLDLIWRIAILYAAQPSILKRRAKVTRIVEAVMAAARRPSEQVKVTTDSPAKARPRRNTLRKMSTPVR